LEAKRVGKPVWELAGLTAAPGPVRTMRTVSVGSVDQMREAAGAFANADVIKVKVDGGSDLKRIEAVHDAVSSAELVVDANEAWSTEQLAAWLPALPELGVKVLEQPLRAGRDSSLERIQHSVLICADESFHDRQSFSGIEDRYDMVNIKLDKAGGLSEALFCIDAAQRSGLKLMLGCMVSTSLAIEPALLLASAAEYVDLDGPLLLEADREGALHERDSGLLHSSPSIWGAA
jgi:L-alanine-DL-glutamate epimerase-like enolase superfamily enzyme